jgi:hypothetical protein
MQQNAMTMANSSTPTTGENAMINSIVSLDTADMKRETTKLAIASMELTD